MGYFAPENEARIGGEWRELIADDRDATQALSMIVDVFMAIAPTLYASCVGRVLEQVSYPHQLLLVKARWRPKGKTTVNLSEKFLIPWVQNRDGKSFVV